MQWYCSTCGSRAAATRDKCDTVLITQLDDFDDVLVGSRKDYGFG